MGERLAGLYGWTWGGSRYMQDLWVQKALRGQDGARLLHAAEQEARTRGRHQVILDSYSFQAPGFIRNTGMRSLRSLKTIRVITGTIICASG